MHLKKIIKLFLQKCNNQKSNKSLIQINPLFEFSQSKYRTLNCIVQTEKSAGTI